MAEQLKANEQAALKAKIHLFRSKIRTLFDSEWAQINAEILAQIPINKVGGIPTDKGKLQFYLQDEVSQGFSHVTSNLHKLWETL